VAFLVVLRLRVAGPGVGLGDDAASLAPVIDPLSVVMIGNRTIAVLWGLQRHERPIGLLHKRKGLGVPRMHGYLLLGLPAGRGRKLGLERSRASRIERNPQATSNRLANSG
jgi:hypothetical protein